MWEKKKEVDLALRPREIKNAVDLGELSKHAADSLSKRLLKKIVEYPFCKQW